MRSQINPKIVTKLVFLGVFVFCFGLGNVVKGEGTEPKLGVSPHTFELDVFPGEKRDEKIKILNQSEVAIPILVRITDFTAEEETGQMILDEFFQDPSFASRFWFEIKNPNFILEPGEIKEVQLSIKVPENAEPGGKYSTVLFEPRLPSYYFKEGQPRVIPVIGVLFLFSVKTFTLEPEFLENSIEIVEFSIPLEQRIENLEKALISFFQIIPKALAAGINIIEKAPSDFILRIKNNDIFHHKLEGKLLIYNIFGKTVGEVEIPRTTILPGKIRKLPVVFKTEIPSYLKWLPASISNFLVQNTFFGKYQARSILTNENAIIEKGIVFWAFPWKIWIPLGFIFSFSIFFGVKYRKRIKLSLKALWRR